MLTHRFDEALRYASDLHRLQYRKAAKIPYISHLLAVAALVIEHGGDEDQAIAALLHDAIEDQGGAARKADIEARFGKAVAELVDACSDAWEHPKPEWRTRKQAFIEDLEQKNTKALLIIASDKLHNIQCVIRDFESHGGEVWQRFKGGKEGTLWYNDTIAERLAELLPGPLSDQLSAAARFLGEKARRLEAQPAAGSPA